MKYQVCKTSQGSKDFLFIFNTEIYPMESTIFRFLGAVRLVLSELFYFCFYFLIYFASSHLFIANAHGVKN